MSKLNKVLSTAIAAAALSTTAPAYAGSGTLDGQLTFVTFGRTLTLDCNSHFVPQVSGNTGERFACQYLDRMADGSPNDSVFIGELHTQARGNLFHMTQYGDGTGYYSIMVGTRDSASGSISGSGINIDGTPFTFTIN